ncbi:MAG: trxA [Chlamydiia bacterium]|nr:trxA [Chlamydiia bacterium]
MTKELIKTIDDENFSQTLSSNGVVLVDFSAAWCGPCRMLEPVLDALASEVQGKVIVATVDVDQAPKTTTSFQITSVPTLILFKQGKEVNRIVGLKDLDTLKKIVLQAV